MDGVVIIESDDSENSILEVEVPKKPTPPLISIEDEEIILNIQQKNEDCILAKDFIENDMILSLMSDTAGSSHGLSSPNHWTSDMIKFYDDDWGDEQDFVVEKLQEKMDKDPSLWDVSKRDRFLLKGNIRKTHAKCWNCGQRGHHFSLCPDPPHIIKCHMCGDEGHAEYFCPNSICLNCGNNSKEYVTCCFKCRNQLTEFCTRCQFVGHSFVNCPDHWRLFHLTTGTTTVRVPDRNINKSERDMWCCNCGRRGHNQIWCKRKKDCGGFLDSCPFVVSYETALKFSLPYNRQYGVPRYGYRGDRREPETRAENLLRINPQNRPIGRDRMDMKNNLKQYKRNKRNRNRNRKKNRQKFFDGMAI